jgi:hypothetical protein
MERAQISVNDMRLAIRFIDAALALDAMQEKPAGSEVARLALEVAAIVHYARPFTGNERTKKTKRPPPMGAPRLGKIDIGPLFKIFLSKEQRALHRDALVIRHKIVAHADSRYFPARLVKAFLPPESGRIGDYAIKSGQTFPRLNLARLRANAKQLEAAFLLHAHSAATEVRKTRKRLRRK